MARHLYAKLLEDNSLAIPHDNAVQNKIWRDSFLQQKILEPLKHHMDEGDIIKKFNEVFNAVAEDVSKRHGAVLYSLQNTDDDGYYNSSAGLVEAPAEENCDYPANWGAMSAIVADSVEAPEPIDPGCGDLTAKEREYLTEMCRVFNDDRAAVQKTFQHFHNHGVSQRLQNLYNESLMDIFDPNDGHSMTEGERKDIDKYMSNGLSHKQAVFKVYKERIGNSSQELKELAQQYDAEESCDEGEETASIKNSWGSDPREDDRDEFWNDDDEDEESPEVEYLPIPEWAINYFVNGEESGLSEDDLEEVRNFEMDYRVEAPDDDAEPYFSNYPAFGLAGTVIDCPCYSKNGDEEDNEELFSGPPSYGYY